MNFKSKILKLLESHNVEEDLFEDLALEIFKYQAESNKVYQKYLSLIQINPHEVQSFSEIPYMPISFYKAHQIKSGDWKEQKIFKSSGTTAMKERSLHYVRDVQWYDQISRAIFQSSPLHNDATIMGLLPSYLENGDSSLVHMVQSLSEANNGGDTFLFIDDFEKMHGSIEAVLKKGSPIVLFGVTFALLDYAEAYSYDSELLQVVFTGGMKNKRTEMSFAEIHKLLTQSFPSSFISSEYGMTELLSQAYSNAKGMYTPGQTMRVVPMQINDPLMQGPFGKTAQMAIADLANYDTLSFILTEDAGVVFENGQFEVLGRLSQSDLRGCNLLYIDKG